MAEREEALKLASDPGARGGPHLEPPAMNVQRKKETTKPTIARSLPSRRRRSPTDLGPRPSTPPIPQKPNKTIGKKIKRGRGKQRESANCSTEIVMEPAAAALDDGYGLL